ncbi:MAG: FlgD immunoglobulin-like domain containing protein [bacterium]
MIAGDVVTVYDPDGIQCGGMRIHIEGWYGLVRLCGDDGKHFTSKARWLTAPSPYGLELERGCRLIRRPLNCHRRSRTGSMPKEFKRNPPKKVKHFKSVGHSSPSAILVFLFALFLADNAAFGQSGMVRAESRPSDPNPASGTQIEVAINIDMSDVNPPDAFLGSFTGSLDWEADVLTHISNSGILAGFTGAVNVSAGHIAFNGVRPTGAEGVINVLNITYDVVSVENFETDLDLEFTAMAAAFTFTDLMPILAVTDGHVHVGAVGGIVSVSSAELPTAFALDQNYPNPFNPITTIHYAIPSREQRAWSEEQRGESREVGSVSELYALRTTLKIYNLLGQEVRTLVDKPKEAGYYTATWDGRDSYGNEVASGVYFYRLTAGNFAKTRKMALLK